MNITKLKEIGNKILEKGVIVNNFTGDLNLEIHKEKISEALISQVKALPKVQRDFLSLYIESKVDCGIERVEKKLDRIIGMQEDQSKEIAKIKKVVGCNGEE